MTQQNLRFTKHALERLFQRNISPEECESALGNGVVVEDYPNDLPFPSKLICGKSLVGRVLHMVYAKDDEIIHIITAYEPDSMYWQDDGRARRKM